MRSVRRFATCVELGASLDEGISNLVVRSAAALTTCAAGNALVDVKACAINYPDIMQTAGAHQHASAAGFVPGMEFSGVITHIGSGGATDFQVGDSVICACGGGGLTTQAEVPVGAMQKMPTGMTFAEASGFTVGYTTAYHCLVERANVQPGEWVLVHGATGGMGLAAVHVCKLLGARVIATGGTDAKLAVVKAQGADHVINYTTTPKFRDAVKAVTGGGGASVVFDTVGGAVFDER
jgi:NADPH2:quinone reductase